MLSRRANPGSDGHIVYADDINLEVWMGTTTTATALWIMAYCKFGLRRRHCLHLRPMLAWPLVHNPEDPQPDNPVLCEISGAAGSTVKCPIKLARKTRMTTPTAIQMKLKYPEEKASSFFTTHDFLLPVPQSAVLGILGDSTAHQRGVLEGGGEMIILCPAVCST